MKMIKNILLEILSIASYTFFPPVWQLVDVTPKKTVALLRQTSHRAIFVHFRKKWSAGRKVRVPSMQINSNRTEPSLVSKPHAKVFPNWTLQSFPWPVLLYVMVHYHEAKLLCVKSFTLRILKIYPLFIVSHNSVEKWLSFVASTISQVVFRFSCCLSFSSCGTHFPTFWIFPMAFKRMETVFRVMFNWSASCCCVWALSSSNNACNSLSWNFFGGLPRSSFLTSKLPFLNFLNHSKHCDLPRACSRKFQQAFDAILQQFFSNGILYIINGYIIYYLILY